MIKGNREINHVKARMVSLLLISLILRTVQGASCNFECSTVHPSSGEIENWVTADLNRKMVLSDRFSEGRNMSYLYHQEERADSCSKGSQKALHCQRAAAGSRETSALSAHLPPIRRYGAHQLSRAHRFKQITSFALFCVPFRAIILTLRTQQSYSFHHNPSVVRPSLYHGRPLSSCF